MEKFNHEELLEVLPVELRVTKELTRKQKVVLGQLLVYNGLDKKDKDGFFFRSNKDLANDCGIQEKTVISAIRKLVYLGLVETKRGSRSTGASYYKVLEDTIKDYCKNNTGDYSKNYSTDTEIDKDIEILINNILIYTSKDTLKVKLKTILEDTRREKELEEREAESAIPDAQPVQTESQASSPSKNELPVTVLEKPAEETHTPVDGDCTPVDEPHT